MSIEKLTENIEIIKQKTNSKIIAVVKANAYGHGVSFISTSLAPYVDMFAVSSIKEGVELRRYTDKDILVLGVSNKKELKSALKNNLILTINSESEALNYISLLLGNKLRVHIGIDSGMNRFGIKSEVELVNTLKILIKHKNIGVEGIYSHLNDGENRKYTLKQIKVFNHFCEIARGFYKGIKTHLQATSGILNYKNIHYDFVRCGILMYGIYGEKFGVEKVSSLKSSVLLVKEVKKGEKIGYNRKFKAKKDMKIAIICGGYADGINKLLSKKSCVIINGTKCRIVGNISMDSFICDISNLNVKVGDSVTIFDNDYTLEKLISNTTLIPYEIFVGLSKRVKRTYD